MYFKNQSNQKPAPSFQWNLLSFSFSYLTEVSSPQSLAIGYQLPAERETKLSLKQKKKKEKNYKREKVGHSYNSGALQVL